MQDEGTRTAGEPTPKPVRWTTIISAISNNLYIYGNFILQDKDTKTAVEPSPGHVSVTIRRDLVKDCTPLLDIKVVRHTERRA